MLGEGGGGFVLCLGSGGEVLDGSDQGLNFLNLGLLGGSQDGNLSLEFGDVLLQGGEAGCHRDLYLSYVIFQVVVVIV